MHDLTIIIVSWNCLEYLRQCLRSILTNPPWCSYEIVLVDNASSDGTVEFVQKSFPHVRVVASKDNRGFAVGNNIALKECTSRYYLLLNPDTVIYPSSLQTLVNFADEHLDAWGVGPAIVNADGSPQQTGVRFPNNWNILVETFFLDRVFPSSRLFGRHRELFSESSNPRVVNYVQGSCLLIRDEGVQEIGMLDEDYFMYFEETDWCYRVHKMGKHIYYCPEAVIKHYGGGEDAHYDKRKVVDYHTGLLRFYKKHYSTASSIVVRCLLTFRCFIRLGVWGMVVLMRPSMRKKGFSTFRGYLHTVPLLWKKI